MDALLGGLNDVQVGKPAPAPAKAAAAVAPVATSKPAPAPASASSGNKKKDDAELDDLLNDLSAVSFSL